MTPPDRLLQSTLKKADKFGIAGKVSSHTSCVMRKPVFRVSDQVKETSG